MCLCVCVWGCVCVCVGVGVHVGMCEKEREIAVTRYIQAAIQVTGSEIRTTSLRTNRCYSQY